MQILVKSLEDLDLSFYFFYNTFSYGKTFSAIDASFAFAYYTRLYRLVLHGVSAVRAS